MAGHFNRTVERNYDGIRLPEFSIGECKNAKRCHNWKAELGNGLCLTCWDKKTTAIRGIVGVEDY